MIYVATLLRLPDGRALDPGLDLLQRQPSGHKTPAGTPAPSPLPTPLPTTGKAATFREILRAQSRCTGCNIKPELEKPLFDNSGCPLTKAACTRVTDSFEEPGAPIELGS